MSTSSDALRGTVHGRTIQLDRDLGLPEGQVVTLVVRPVLSSGEGIRQSAGAWSDDPAAVDAWLEQMQRSRLDRENAN
jgi:hypothetical protein